MGVLFLDQAENLMLTRIGTITVQVSDQDRALEFYTQKLGFEKRTDMPMGPGQRWIEVAPPGAQTRILLYKATPEAPGAPSYEAAQASIGTSTGMVLEVDDIEATFAALKANGVPITDEPSQQPYGWWGVFADQDGNTYGVHQ
jgi:predicted enzyme related to lactoylglutathione lyase